MQHPPSVTTLVIELKYTLKYTLMNSAKGCVLSSASHCLQTSWSIRQAAKNRWNRAALAGKFHVVALQGSSAHHSVGFHRLFILEDSFWTWARVTPGYTRYFYQDLSACFGLIACGSWLGWLPCDWEASLHSTNQSYRYKCRYPNHPQ